MRNIVQSHMSGQTALMLTYPWMANMPELYIIRNPIDPNKYRFKVRYGVNLIHRLNTYYKTYYICNILAKATDIT